MIKGQNIRNPSFTVTCQFAKRVPKTMYLICETPLMLTLCLPRSPICTSVNVPRSPICTVIHTPMVHSYCSMKWLPLFLVRTVCMRYSLPFWNFPYNLQVKRYSELNIVLLNVAPITVCPKIMWHTGDLYLANKELMK